MTTPTDDDHIAQHPTEPERVEVGPEPLTLGERLWLLGAIVLLLLLLVTGTVAGALHKAGTLN